MLLDRTNLIKQKEEMEETKNTKSKTKELDNIVAKILESQQIDKIYLYKLIDKIEIDKDKKEYIHFKFSNLNFINENLEELSK